MRLFAGPYGLRAVIVALGLSAALGYMVWGRVQLLQTGNEIVLKTVPVDPRDLFRGHYVILRYDITSLKTKKFNTDTLFSRHQRVFVSLKQGEDSLWHAVSVHDTRPAPAPDIVTLAGTIKRVWPTPPKKKQKREEPE